MICARSPNSGISPSTAHPESRVPRSREALIEYLYPRLTTPPLPAIDAFRALSAEERQTVQFPCRTRRRARSQRVRQPLLSRATAKAMAAAAEQLRVKGFRFFPIHEKPARKPPTSTGSPKLICQPSSCPRHSADFLGRVLSAMPESELAELGTKTRCLRATPRPTASS